MAAPAPPDPDAALMLQARQGDAAAFAALVERWRQPVVNFLYRMLPDAEEAEDLAQAVFVQVWKTAGRYEPTARFSTFLFTVARNLCLNELRRRARHPAQSLEEPPAGGDADEGAAWTRQVRDPAQTPADHAAQNRELVGKVEAALAALPEKQRVALVLCREGELSYEEIAAVLGVTVPATKSLIHRARETLKARLKPYLRTGEWTGAEAD
jgi:RNA polymerase sigma-70 factor, ECF subfamily